MRLRFRTQYANIKGIQNAEQILARNLRGSLEGIGRRLIASAQSRMRSDSGAEKKSLRFQVNGRGISLSLDVFSTLIQAFIDAYGLPRGTFPPFAVGTRIYQWAERKVKLNEYEQKERYYFTRRETAARIHHNNRLTGRFTVKAPRRIKQVQGIKTPNAAQRQKSRQSEIKRVAYLAARSIFQNGIAPTYWNVKTLEANQTRIMLDLRNGITRAVNEINRG